MSNQLSSFRTRLARLEEAREEIAATVDRIQATELPGMSMSGVTDVHSFLDALKANGIAGATALINASSTNRAPRMEATPPQVIEAEVIPTDIRMLPSSEM